MDEVEMVRAQEITKANEGMRLRPYVDTVGKMTIGHGRNLSDRGISPGEAYALFRNDWDDALIHLLNYRWFGPLSAPRQAALIDMRFNLGAAGFEEFHHMILALEAGAFLVAATAMLDSAWAQQVGPRAERNARMMETGEWPS
jgi:lysozyme